MAPEGRRWLGMAMAAVAGAEACFAVALSSNGDAAICGTAGTELLPATAAVSALRRTVGTLAVVFGS